jgi:hypothetical protein
MKVSRKGAKEERKGRKEKGNHYALLFAAFSPLV